MSERIYQLRFGENFKPAVPEDITPKGFAGLEFDKGREIGRFVREVPDRVYIKSPSDGVLLIDYAQYRFSTAESQRFQSLLTLL